MIPIANPCAALELRLNSRGDIVKNAYEKTDLFEMWAGSERAYVWAKSFTDALEAFVDWLDEEGKCGPFATIGISDLEDAADDLGIPRAVAHAPQHPDFYKVVETAEANLGLTLVGGHTTLQNCPNPGYFESSNWGGDELHWTVHLDVVQRSYAGCGGHDFLPGEIVWAYDDIEGYEILEGDRLKVIWTSPSTIQVEDTNTQEEVTIDEDYLKLLSRVPVLRPQMPSPPRTVTSEEEKRRMMDFFFPKSTLPKSRPGGGGFLGMPRGPLRIENFFGRRRQ